MYNHARTLLMNLDGEGQAFHEYPADELIPREFKAVNMPDYLRIIRARLFGASPDRAMLNYRCRQFLSLIETTDLQEYVLALDSRLTYDFSDSTLLDKETFQPKIQTFPGTPKGSLTITGKPVAPDASGVSRYDFQLETISGNLQVRRLSPPPQTDLTPLTMVAGLSQEIPLPFSGYRVRLGTDQDGLQWRVSGFLRPSSRSLGNIEGALHSVGEPHLISLFGADPQEPFLTFRNCWKKHPEFAYRLGGILLAVIYRTEELRNG